MCVIYQQTRVANSRQDRAVCGDTVGAREKCTGCAVHAPICVHFVRSAACDLRARLREPSHSSAAAFRASARATLVRQSRSGGDGGRSGGGEPVDIIRVIYSDTNCSFILRTHECQPECTRYAAHVSHSCVYDLAIGRTVLCIGHRYTRAPRTT